MALDDHQTPGETGSEPRTPGTRGETSDDELKNLGIILDIDLPLAVRFGATQMSLDALTKLGPGAVIDLLRTPDAPVDVLVSGKLVARGVVVVVEGNYGVRITDVMSRAERTFGLGGEG